MESIKAANIIPCSERGSTTLDVEREGSTTLQGEEEISERLKTSQGENEVTKSDHRGERRRSYVRDEESVRVWPKSRV